MEQEFFLESKLSEFGRFSYDSREMFFEVFDKFKESKNGYRLHDFPSMLSLELAHRSPELKFYNADFYECFQVVEWAYDVFRPTGMSWQCLVEELPSYVEAFLAKNRPEPRYVDEDEDEFDDFDTQIQAEEVCYRHSYSARPEPGTQLIEF
jgi:hypothetical protein